MIRSLREAGVLWRRNMLKLTRVPMLLFFSLFQPLLFLLLFSQVFSRLSEMPGFGYENYLQFLVPTIVGLTTLNSAFQSGMGMVNDIDDGLLDKFLIAPIRRSSILLGKVLADATRMALQALLILGFAYIMGARVETGILGVGLLILIAVLFGIAWAGISNVVALRTGNAELTMLIGILITFATETHAGLEHPHLAAWAPRIPGEDRLTTKQSLRKEQYPGFQFQEIDAEGRLVPAEPRDEYYPFTYITPSSTETNALAGLDLAAEPRLREAI